MWWIIVAIILAVFALIVYLLRKYKKIPGQRFTRIKEFAPVVAACCAVIMVAIALIPIIRPRAPATKPDPPNQTTSEGSITPSGPESPDGGLTEPKGETSPAPSKKEPPRPKPDPIPPPIPPDSKPLPQYNLTFDIRPPRDNVKVYIDGKLISSEKFFTVVVDSGSHEVRVTSKDDLGILEYLDTVAVPHDGTIIIESSEIRPDR